MLPLPLTLPPPDCLPSTHDNLTWTNQWMPSASADDKIAALDLWLTAFPRIRLLVIDSLDQLSATPSSITAQDTPQQELALVHQLKALASHHRIAILLVTQLSAKNSRHSPNELMHTPMLALAGALLFW